MKFISRSTLLLHVLVVAGSTGCGAGGVTQEEMMRHAIRRMPEEEAPNANSRDSELASNRADAPQQTAAEEKVPAPAASGRPTPADVLTSPDLAPVRAAGAEDIAAVTTAEEALQHARRNLARIGEALALHVEQRRCYPAPAITFRDRPMLSWRVALLPYLGEQELFNQFRLNEPWDSRHNLQLLELVPQVYQDPERKGTATNFLAVVGPGTVFHEPKGLHRAALEDGYLNTLLIVEADDEAAVPWTKPADLEVSREQPRVGFGQKREPRVLSVWAEGTVRVLDANAADSLYWGAMTYDMGESVLAVDLAYQDAVAAENAYVSTESAPTQELPSRGETVASLSPPLAVTEPRAIRQPLPPLSRRQEALQIVKDRYQEEYRRARTPAARTRLAQRMLDVLPSLADDPAGEYVLLEVALKVAQAGDNVQVVRVAADEMERRFEVDSLAMKIELIGQLAAGLPPSKNDPLVDWAIAVGYEALEEERYHEARHLASLTAAQLRSHRGAAARRTAADLQQLREAAELGERLHARARDALQQLATTPGDPAARLVLGRYLCLVRQDWPNGLAVLAGDETGGSATATSGEDGPACTLKLLAERELHVESHPEAHLELADAWWDLADQHRGAAQRALLRHALHWYRVAFSGLPEGLKRVHAEHRMQQLASQLPEQPLRRLPP